MSATPTYCTTDSASIGFSSASSFSDAHESSLLASASGRVSTRRHRSLSAPFARGPYRAAIAAVLSSSRDMTSVASTCRVAVASGRSRERGSEGARGGWRFSRARRFACRRCAESGTSARANSSRIALESERGGRRRRASSRRRGRRVAHLERHAGSAHPRRFQLLGDVLAVRLGVQIRASFQRERDVEPARATFRRRPLRLRQVPERLHRPNLRRAQVQRLSRMTLEVAEAGAIGHGDHPRSAEATGESNRSVSVQNESRCVSGRSVFSTGSIFR